MTLEEINNKLKDLSNDYSEKEIFESRNNIDSNILGYTNNIEGIISKNISELPKIAGESLNNTLNIRDNLTSINYTNGYLSRIKYIVIHFTANNGDTAYSNTDYFKSQYRGASAHYFVDEYSTIWRCVEDKNISWHCGGGLQGNSGHSFYGKCTNSNSIGIELCSRKSNGKYYFKDSTISNVVWLVKYLMNKYNIPISNVIRHYDVTGKICPEPFVNDVTLWNNFKQKLLQTNESAHWAQEFLDKLISKNVITDKNQWNDFDSAINKSLCLSLLDKITGGTWKSNQADSKVHWCQPTVISLCGKGIINNPEEWINSLDNRMSKGLTLALICNMTGGVLNRYKDRIVDHWARNHLDTLCDRGIIQTPQAWTNFDGEVSKGEVIGLFYKSAYNK